MPIGPSDGGASLAGDPFWKYGTNYQPIDFWHVFKIPDKKDSLDYFDDPANIDSVNW
jgi:hypothetical protein